MSFKNAYGGWTLCADWFPWAAICWVPLAIDPQLPRIHRGLNIRLGLFGAGIRL